MYLLPLSDVDASVAELHRLVERGARAVQLPLYPADARIAPYYDPVYEPLWSAIEEAGIPISLHVCPPGGRGLSGDPTPAKGLFQAMPPIFMSQALSEWIVTGTFVRHPALQVVLVEAGLGWIPYMLDRLDRVAVKSRWAERGMDLAEPPSFYWHHNMHATFEEDELGWGCETSSAWTTSSGPPTTPIPTARGQSRRRSSSSSSPAARPRSGKSWSATTRRGSTGCDPARCGCPVDGWSGEGFRLTVV